MEGDMKNASKWTLGLGFAITLSGCSLLDLELFHAVQPKAATAGHSTAENADGEPHDEEHGTTIDLPEFRGPRIDVPGRSETEHDSHDPDSETDGDEERKPFPSSPPPRDTDDPSDGSDPEDRDGEEPGGDATHDQEGGYSCPQGFFGGSTDDGLLYCGVPIPHDSVAFCDSFSDTGFIGFYFRPPADDLFNFHCPAGTTHREAHNGSIVCGWEGVALPDASDLTAHCPNPHQGFIGFYWNLPPDGTNDIAQAADDIGETTDPTHDDPDTTNTDQPEDDTPTESDTLVYSCPDGFRYATNLGNLAFCVVPIPELPQSPSLSPYCHYIDDGYMGFSWSIADDPSYQCPAGAAAADNGAGDRYCLWQPIVLPQVEDVKAYCHWLHDGYIGFHWPLASADGTEGPNEHPDHACDDMAAIDACIDDVVDPDDADPVDPTQEEPDAAQDDVDDPLCPTNTYMLAPRICSDNSEEAAASYNSCLQMLGGSNIPDGNGSVFTPAAFCQIYIDCDGDFEHDNVMYCGQTGNWAPGCSTVELTFEYCE
jgi:hypothetical protein